MQQTVGKESINSLEKSQYAKEKEKCQPSKFKEQKKRAQNSNLSFYFFLINITQFEKTGSISKISLGNYFNSIFEIISMELFLTFFVTLTLSLFDSGVRLPLNKRNELNLKNQKSNRKKIKFEPEQI